MIDYQMVIMLSKKGHPQETKRGHKMVKDYYEQQGYVAEKLRDKKPGTEFEQILKRRNNSCIGLTHVL